MTATPSPSWEGLLRTPHPCDHLVQLYNDDAFLARAVSLFTGLGLSDGEGAVIIATPEHAELFKKSLRAAALDVDAMIARHQLQIFNAQSSLDQFMVDGMPDRDKFVGLVMPVFARARAAGYEKIRLYGEMVNLLWDHNMPGTIALEELWNQVLADTGLSLLCAYSIDNFDRHAHRGVLHQISRCHSHFIPVEDYGRLEKAVDRAYADVFGMRGDPRSLRSLISARVAANTVMPPAQAALLALNNLSTGISDAVIERTRFHYGSV
jgi:MEDS: MEthanogen/methylotroph, DcmR Sensory domain